MHAVETTQKADFLHGKPGSLKSSHWSLTYDVEMYVLRSIHTGSSRPNYCAVLCHSQRHAISSVNTRTTDAIKLSQAITIHPTEGT
jgi:hypothetical protein